MPEDLKTDEFDWVAVKRDLDKILNPESGYEKFVRKFNENPAIPIGCVLTISALTLGLWSFRNGDSKRSQLMMRLRIGAQGFTFMALVSGIAMAAFKK